MTIYSSWATCWRLLVYILAFQNVVLKEQHQHHLGAYRKCRSSGPSPDMQIQNVHLTKIQR